MDTDTSDAQVIYSLSKNSTSSVPSEACITESFDIETIPAIEPHTILSIIWRHGTLGAAYFNLQDSQLYILSDMVDLEPDFNVIKLMLRVTNPKHIISIGTTCDEFIKCIIDTVNSQNASVSSDQMRIIPQNMTLLPYKEYSYNACDYKLREIKLTSNTTEHNNDTKNTYMHSIINFENKLSVHALGAVIKYTEKHWAQLNSNNSARLSFVDIHQTTLDDYVFMDYDTYQALQIFRNKKHDSSFKHNETVTREGCSLFKLYAQNCKSKIGFLTVKNLMLNPIKNMDILNMRLDFIEFAVNTANSGFISNLQDNIKRIYNLQKILLKIKHTRADSNNWILLYKTIYHILSINELCLPYIEGNLLMRKLTESVKTNLYDIEQCISNALEMKTNRYSRRPTIKAGLDDELDAKRLQRQDINKSVTAAAQYSMKTFPDYIDECTIVYIPDVGHVIAIKQLDNSHYIGNELQDMNFLFLFKLNGLNHYKNPMCEELDNQLGDIQKNIIAHENRILQRLADLVIEHTPNILEPLKLVALIDCLISVAKASLECRFIRPQLNEDSIHEIVDGRHPLIDFTGHNYVANSLLSGGEHSRIKIITGANGSGKTVYLKQVGVLIYLAHLGFFIPAKQANVGIVHSIHTRLYAKESASLRLSSFQIDLTQMGRMLRNARHNSLLLIDEFGKGTTGVEGHFLLAGAISDFLHAANLCPHVLVATHFENLIDTIRTPSNQSRHHLLSSHQMEYTLDPKTGTPVFLYHLVPGVSGSFALQVARSIGICSSTVDRADDIQRQLESPTEEGGGMLLPVSGGYSTQSPVVTGGYGDDVDRADSFYWKITVPEVEDDSDGE